MPTENNESADHLSDFAADPSPGEVSPATNEEADETQGKWEVHDSRMASIEALEGTCLVGWAVDKRQIKDPVQVEIHIEKIGVIGKGTADLMRADLIDALGGTGKNAFKIEVSSELVPVGVHELLIIDQQSDKRLESNPCFLESDGSGRLALLSRRIPTLKAGGIDFIKAGIMYGWALYPSVLKKVMTVHVLHDGRVVGIGTADVLREDLGKKFNSSGRHALVVKLNLLNSMLQSEKYLQLTIVDSSDGQVVAEAITANLQIQNPSVLVSQHMQKKSLRGRNEGNEKAPVTFADAHIRLIAMYLPQFHPTPYNDEWWGKGFTEWKVVSAAKSLYKDHVQPKMPTDLGFYDLRLDEIRHEQAKLARRNGIHGWCYYYYSFSGKRLLETPLDRHLEDKTLPMPFCLSWANETWSRRWDGSERDILIQQQHTPEFDRQFIVDIAKYLKDQRYIRVDGAPLIIIYRSDLLSEPFETTKLWRKTAQELGIGEIHLCAAQTFGFTGAIALGFDSMHEFPPHGIKGESFIDGVEDLDPEFKGKIYDYREIVHNALQTMRQDVTKFYGVMPSWDNTPRRGVDATIFANASPELFGLWLTNACSRTVKDKRNPDHRLIFINAWNEWAEGAVLEPSNQFGSRYLEMVNTVVNGPLTIEDAIAALRDKNSENEDPSVAILLDAIELRSRQNQASLSYYHDSDTRFWQNLNTIRMTGVMRKIDVFQYMNRGVAAHYSDLAFRDVTKLNIEQVGPYRLPLSSMVEVANDELYVVTGWTFNEANVAPSISDPVLIVMLNETTELVSGFLAPCFQARMPRSDVKSHFIAQGYAGTGDNLGFRCLLDLSAVPPGKYHIGIASFSSNGVGTINISPSRVRVW